MNKPAARIVKAVSLALTVLLPAAVMAQRTFIYQPSDMRTLLVGSSAPAQIQVRTVIVIQSDPSMAIHPLADGKAYEIALKPPMGSKNLLMAMFEDQMVSVIIRRSDLDGEMVGTVMLPSSAHSGSNVYLQWLSPGSIVLETQTEVTSIQ